MNNISVLGQLKRWRNYVPLTNLGVAFVVFGIILLRLGEVRKNVIFALGGFVLCGMVVLLFLSNLLTRLVPLRGKLSINASPIDSSEIFTFSLRIANYFMFPLVQLRPVVWYRFGGNRDGGDKVTTVLQSGELSDVLFFCLGKAELSLERTFPHRGVINLERFEIQFRDLLGLSIFRLNIPLKDFLPASEFVVIPPLQRGANPSFEMMSNDAFEDDLLSNTGEKKGAWVDLLPYQPEMGARKIAWKIYARSEELYIREMERTISFNQEWILLVIAPDNDDAFVSTLLEYFKQVDAELRIGGCGFNEVCTGTHGLLQAFSKSVGHVNVSEIEKRRADLGDCLVVAPDYLFDNEELAGYLESLPKVCKVSAI